MTNEERIKADSEVYANRYLNGRVNTLEFCIVEEGYIAGATAEQQRAQVEINRRNKILEDDLKRQCRLNMPGISEQEQEAAWQAFKAKHNL